MNDVRVADKCVTVSVEIGSKEWANESLRWFLREILYSPTWQGHPYFKILIGEDLAERLVEKGFPWQAERIRNHLHRWLKSIACRSRGPDTLSNGERERGSP